MASSSSTLPTSTAATAATLNLHFSPEWMRTGASPSSTSSAAAVTAATSKLPGMPTGLTSTQPNGHDSLGIGIMTPAPSSMQQPSPVHGLNASQTLPYSSLLTPAPTTNAQSKLMPNAGISTDTDPFRYSRDMFLSIWRAGAAANGGSGWRLGIEVERHDGVVVDVENTPACAKEMTEAEIKLYQSSSLNSRRPSVSHGHSHASRDGEPVGLGILGRRGTGGEGLSMAMPTSSSIRGNSAGGGPASPLRERFSRRDSTGTSQPYRPRQLTTPAATPNMDGTPPIVSPRTTSGGFGFGGGPGFDGVLSAGEGWGGRKRGPAGALPSAIRQGSSLRDIHEKTGDREHGAGPDRMEKEKVKDPAGAAAGSASGGGDGNEKLHGPNGRLANGDAFGDGSRSGADIEDTALGGKAISEEPAFENWEDDPEIANADSNSVEAPVNGVDAAAAVGEESSAQKSPPNPAQVKWQYVDDQQIMQGPFPPEDLTLWEKSNWLRPDLRMNRPEYDTMFLPLSTWKAKMEETKNGGDDKGVFFTWFEPIHEPKPSPPKKVIQPPPGLSRHDAQPSQYDGNVSAPVHRSVSPPKQDAPTPSVFEVLRRVDHAPSPVFGEAGFSHSPVSSHRLSMKGAAAGLESTHTSSPASSHTNVYGEPEHAGVMRQPNAGVGVFHQGMNYIPHNALPTSLARGISSGSNSSPLVGYSSPMGGMPYSAGAASELGSLGMQPPYPSQAGNMYGNLGMRKPSYEQFAPPTVAWQGNVQGHSHRGSNLISGVAPTSSTTSSLSNVPRAHFGGRRSPSPAGFPNQNANGGLTSSLGGEVYEGALPGSTFHTAIGWNGGSAGNLGGGHSPQQQYGTLYRSPVPPIPEMSHSVDIGTVVGIHQLASEVPYSIAPQGHALSAMATDATVILPRKPSLEPMGAAWTMQQQQEQGARLQPLNVQASLPDVSTVVPSSENSSAKGPAAKEEPEKKGADTLADVTTAGKPKAAPVPATPKEEEDDNAQPFIPVKKQHRAPVAQVADPAPAPLPSASISTTASVPNISQSSSKMTVPLASLITNPPPAINATQTPTAPAKAWATIPVKDEAKGIKEIQEAEAKRTKENEKLKARPTVSPVVSPGGAPSAKDEEVGTLMTWGLPTSMAGARAGKDAAAGSGATSPPVAVWTSVGAAKVVGAAGNGAKKATMKDIQEEEERRRKKERDVVTVAKRVGDKPPAPAPTQASGGNTVWSTVGASGKATRPSTGGSSATTTPGASTVAPTGIAALPPRPSAAAIASSGMRTAHNNSAATSSMGAMPAAGQPPRRTVSTATSATSIKLAGKGSNGDDSGVGHAGNVSAETLKWMRETLKGKLVKGITVEEVVGLVLMMHEEDDIADTIYQSSPTLPGKRFAAEFMEKRRADRGHGGGSAAASSGASTRGGTASAGSGAESAGARLQPTASASQDAFGFKVVKKKGRGGKA